MCYIFEYSGGLLGALTGGKEQAEAEAGYRKSPSNRVQTWPMGHALFEYDHSGLHSIA